MVDNKYFTFIQANEYLKSLGLKIGINKFRKFINHGEIAIIQLGQHKRYISEQALQEFINKHTGVYKQ